MFGALVLAGCCGFWWLCFCGGFGVCLLWFLHLLCFTSSVVHACFFLRVNSRLKALRTHSGEKHVLRLVKGQRPSDELP